MIAINTNMGTDKLYLYPIDSMNPAIIKHININSNNILFIIMFKSQHNSICNWTGNN